MRVAAREIDRPSPEARCPHSLAESTNLRFTVRFCLKKKKQGWKAAEERHLVSTTGVHSHTYTATNMHTPHTDTQQRTHTKD